MQVHLFREFLTRQDGGVTVEFVVIFPLLFLMTLFVIFVCMFLSTASDVQQIAHDLSRASFRYIGDPTSVNMCQKLQQTVLPVLIDASFLLEADRLTLKPCTNVPNAQGLLTITVEYNFVGSFLQSLAKNFNLDLGMIRRSSSILV